MRIRIFSDLHFESGRNPLEFTPPDDADLVILAGNIGLGAEGVYWAKYTFRRTRVVYVLGSAEYDGTPYNGLIDECQHVARGSTVTVLERDTLDIGGVRVLGTTLWANFSSIDEWTSAELFRDWQTLFAQTEAKEFVKSVRWLDHQISSADRPLIVVTHNAPMTAPSSELDADRTVRPMCHLLRSPVRLWVHGHTHVNVDARVQGVRVVTNQLGCAGDAIPDFRADGLFVVDL
ncbi:metallophosphoesterase [Sinimarinibacterium sp. CAU 1509]|uniref:metallophosphoesterase n=1 Tax=Sinimarinibacterium sp. CAU 1509 TaxID=2562283 RepID=UPI00146C6A1E|nr:metallophosphoesterase [Sinimarinibacterium sp. CAU 1509]